MFMSTADSGIFAKMATKFFLAVLTLSALTSAEEIKAKPGDDVTLQCQSVSDTDITMFYWSRPDLTPRDFIFYYRDNRSYDDYQHATVQGRVQLRDASLMKDGDVSVILKNVTASDFGTYYCHVGLNSKEPHVTNNITLKVVDSEIEAKPGNDVTLQCQSPRDTNITMFLWTRPELEEGGFIFFFKENRSHDDIQHPTVGGRVQLRDASSIKDGDVSVILKNVTINDSGTYMCYVAVIADQIQLRNLIILKVED